MKKENEINITPTPIETRIENNIINNVNEELYKNGKISQINSNNKNVSSKKANSSTKKELTPYQKFLYCKNSAYEKYKQRYFDFYDDVKDKTHRIYDW